MPTILRCCADISSDQPTHHDPCVEKAEPIPCHGLLLFIRWRELIEMLAPVFNLSVKKDPMLFWQIFE